MSHSKRARQQEGSAPSPLRDGRSGSAIEEYLIIVVLGILIFVPFLVPLPGARMGTVYDTVRNTFGHAMIFISLPFF